MTPSKYAATVCLVVACTTVFALSASAAPQQLLNKTIIVSFNVSVPAKGEDGSTINGSRSSQRTIYISGQGRIFSRANRSEGRHAEQKEAGPEATSIHVEGNRLIGVMKFPSGASQLTVSFDPSFQSCTAEVFAGAESGKPIVFKGLNGKMYTTTGKMQFSGASCSIRDGNAFAE